MSHGVLWTTIAPDPTWKAIHDAADDTECQEVMRVKVEAAAAHARTLGAIEVVSNEDTLYVEWPDGTTWTQTWWVLPLGLHPQHVGSVPRPSPENLACLGPLVRQSRARSFD